MHGLILAHEDLPKLKALSITQSAILETPTLLPHNTGRPITHLRLDDMSYLSTNFCLNLVQGAASTLRHLELSWFIHDFRMSLPHFGDLLKAAPKLAELRIAAESANTDPPPLPLNEGDLRSLLSSIHDATGITVLHLIDSNGDFLPKSLLDDVGVVPQSLKYLVWDVRLALLTYRLESQNGKTVAIEVEPPPTGTILNLVSECGYDPPAEREPIIWS